MRCRHTSVNTWPLFLLLCQDQHKIAMYGGSFFFATCLCDAGVLTALLRSEQKYCISHLDPTQHGIFLINFAVRNIGCKGIGKVSHLVRCKGDVQIFQDICPDQHFYTRYSIEPIMVSNQRQL